MVLLESVWNFTMGFLPVEATAAASRGGTRGGRGEWNSHKLLIVLIISVVSLLLETEGYEINEYCRWETFNATCPGNSVILMRSARYGRMQKTRCLDSDYFIGCAADAIIHADSRCSGRRSCVIGVPDETLHEVQPCPKDLMAYLEAGYECVPVASGGGRPCQANNPPEMTQSLGYIASVVTEDEGYGTTYCPWVIKVDKGQKINMTLYDFSILTYSQDSPLCQVYANIKERTRTRDVTVCGGSKRERHLMVSDTNEVVVEMISHAAQGARPFFLLKYEAVGCPNVAAPVGGWAQRSEDSLVVGCNGTTLKWHLVCKGSKWVGEIKNCTQGSQPWSLEQALSEGGGFPYGLLISVAIGVLLGIVLGTVMLGVVLVCRRRRQHGKEKKAHTLLKQAPEYPIGRPMSQGHGGERPIPSTLEKHATMSSTKNGGYAHIWELRQEQGSTMGTLDRHRHANKRSTMASEPGDYNMQFRQVSGPVGPHPLHRDHVYESPKPARREDEIYNSNAIPYYHEFDPSDVEANEIGLDMKCSGGEMHSRNNNLRGTFSMGEE